ncbi:hypothetical protein K2X33_05920 [bacterium]|nr:hypothetical protein [bacterium]
MQLPLPLGFLIVYAVVLGQAWAQQPPAEADNETKLAIEFSNAIENGEVEKVKTLVAAHPKLIDAPVYANSYLSTISPLALAYDREYFADALSDYDRKEELVAENYRQIQKILKEAGGRYFMSKKNSEPNVLPMYWLTKDPTFYSRFMADIKNAKTFRLEDFERLLKDPSIKDAADLFRKLPVDFRTDSLALYESFAEDRHLVSDKTPRVIATNDFADFAIVAQGNDLSKVQAYQFNYDAKPKRFDLYHAPLSGPHRGLSSANPAECAVCHRKAKVEVGSHRPNWAPYFGWRGSWGHIDDEFKSDRHPPVRPFAEEITAAQQFLAIQKDHPLYSQLPDFAERLTKMMNEEPNTRRTHSPNVRFTANVYALNEIRIAEELLNNPSYSGSKYELLAILGGCPAAVTDKEVLDKIDKAMKGTPLTKEMSLPQTVAQLVALDKANGSNFAHEGAILKNWAMLHGPQIITEGPMSRGTGDGFQFEIGVLLMHMDPELRPYFPRNPRSRSIGVDCPTLQRKLDEKNGVVPHKGTDTNQSPKRHPGMR